MGVLVEQVVRFGAVGILNSIVGLACIWAAMMLGVLPLPANALGFGIGLTISFVLNRAWTFRDAVGAERPRRWTETAPQFLVAFAVGWAFNAAAVWTAISTTTVSPYVAQILGVLVYSVAFFFMCRMWVFAAPEPGAGARTRWAGLLRCAALLCPLAVALAYLTWKALDVSVANVDFKYLWYAGHLWAEGASPYGAQYYERAQAFFINTNVPKWMVYPPSWYPLAYAVALLPLEFAERLWGVFSALGLLASGALVARTVWPHRAHDRIWPFAAFGIFLCMGSATANALSLGQTAPLMAIGLALFFYGFIARSQLALCAALVVLMLKPNFGLPFVVFLLVWPNFWLAVIGAGAVTLIAALMALLPYGPVAVLQAYMELLSGYGADPVNAPPSLTGLANVTYYIFGVKMGGFLPVGLAVVVVFALALWLRTEEANSQSPDALRLATMLALLASVLFLAPLHTYDLLLAAPLLLLPALAFEKWGVVTISSLICFLVIFRANNLASVTGLTSPAETYFAGSAIASVAMLLLLLGSLVHLRKLARGPGGGLL